MPPEESERMLMRVRVYGLLRRVFSHEVDEALLAWVQAQEGQGFWTELGLDVGDALASADSDALIEQLAVDFCRLFVTSGAAGTPHESAQRGTAGAPLGRISLLWGDAASATRRLCREAGFELDDEANRIPDALTAQFEFMERLAEAEAAAREAGCSADVQRLQDLQRRMLSEHLVRWVPAYGRKLMSRAETGFYRAMLDLAAQFVEWDAGQLCGRQESLERSPVGVENAAV